MSLSIKSYSTTISGILLIILATAHLRGLHTAVATTALAVLICWLSILAGARFLPNKRITAQYAAGLTGVGTALMIILAGIYWAYKITWIESFTAIAVITFAVHFLSQSMDTATWFQKLKRHIREIIAHYWFFLLLLLPLAGAIALLFYLYTHGTLGSIRTPWKFIDQTLFFSGAAAIGAILWLAAWKKTPALRPLHIAFYTLLFTSVGLLIFKIGYGFDPFVHRATEQHIFNNGLITPKPLWYVGQHALVVAFSHITGLGINLIDKLLLPCAAALLIPAWLYVVAPQSWHRRALLFLMLPLLSWFVSTTPQGIANLLYLILIIQVPLVFKKQLSWQLPTLTTLAIATLHPSTALPAFLILLFTALIRKKLRLRYTSAVAAIAGLGLPAMFFVNEWKQIGGFPSFNTLISRATERLASLLPPLTKGGLGGVLDEVLQNSFWAFANAAYTVRILIFVFAAGCVCYGIYKLKNKPMFQPYLLSTAALTVSAALLYLFNALPLVISYEQSDYALRTLWIIGFTLLPFFWFGGLAFLSRLKTHKTPIIILTVLMLTAGMVTNLYFLYPRVDRMANHKGYSTGLSDLTAIEFIEFQNPGGNYIVLANQSVSAGALKQLGFKYEFYVSFTPPYQGEAKEDFEPIYFYPIPTGGKLYQYFLQMIDETPTRDVANQAMDVTGADRVYLVVNNYWWRDHWIIAKAKLEADWWTTIDGETIHLFAWQRGDPDRGWLVEDLTKK